MGPIQNEFIEMEETPGGRQVNNPIFFRTSIACSTEFGRERGSGPGVIDFKTSSGGIIEGEFLVQALQMRANLWEPNWNRAVDALRKNNQLAESETKKLKTAYDFLRRCESVLRRYENASLSGLPPDAGEVKRFSRRMNFDSAEAFTAKYESARTATHEIYLSRVGSSATNEPVTSPTLAEQKS